MSSLARPFLAAQPQPHQLPVPVTLRALPILAAAIPALAYVLISPMSLDLAAHLFRAQLFRMEGFGLWNNWWYAGHHLPGYSVLFPPLAAALSPQLVAAVSAVLTAALFASLAYRHLGPRAWLGATWFGAATAIDLYTGRLTFAFGLLPAMATAVALQRHRIWGAGMLAFLTALASPVAALLAALAGAARAVGGWWPERRRGAVLAGTVTVLGALLPVLALVLAFPEGGTEPFSPATLWPLVVVALVMIVVLPRRQTVLRAGVMLYLIGCVLAYAVPSPVGSNAARLGPLLAGPLAALILWPRRRTWLVLVSLPLLYIQWQAPVRDVRTAAGDPSGRAVYWQPLLRFLATQPGPPFRIEIPFTQFHMEAFRVASRISIARGWERQVDIHDNRLFYDGTLSPATYRRWLHRMAIRYVALSDVHLDYAGRREQALVARGLPYLHLVLHSSHWRVYEVQDPTPIVSGAARLTGVGPNSLTLWAEHPGRAYVRVHFTPYWRLSLDSGCVFPVGDFTGVQLKAAGPARLVISFSLARIGDRSPRCSVTGTRHGRR